MGADSEPRGLWSAGVWCSIIPMMLWMAAGRGIVERKCEVRLTTILLVPPSRSGAVYSDMSQCQLSRPQIDRKVVPNFKVADHPSGDAEALILVPVVNFHLVR